MALPLRRGGFPDGATVVDGHVTMPELPGSGFEGKRDRDAEMRALAERAAGEGR